LFTEGLVFKASPLFKVNDTLGNEKRNLPGGIVFQRIDLYMNRMK